ncbi:MAG: hypothetical protein OHK0015_18280 [Chloroflexi bacterium OHK40]
MSMPEPHLLAPAELVPGRPFTDPERIDTDLAVLDAMRTTLHAVVATIAEAPDGLIYLPEADGRTHRVVLLNRAGLLAPVPLAVVGFFGERRHGAEDERLAALDAELIDELRSHPYMLSYSSRELASGRWANLVLLTDYQGASRWRASARHSYAVAHVAPEAYSRIRLHNALLPGGLGGPPMIHVRTAYYDFEGPTLWHAVRPARNAPTA